MKRRTLTACSCLRSLTISLALLATTTFASPEVLPSPPVFDGRDGLQPSMRISYSHIVETPTAPAFHPLWVASEGWHERGRSVTIYRCRFGNRKEAKEWILSDGNPGKKHFLKTAQGTWDDTPVAGQTSVCIPARSLGIDILMFVMDKEFVFMDYAHPAFQNSTSMSRLLTMAHAVEAKIQARNESGANEPEADGVPTTLTLSVSSTKS